MSRAGDLRNITATGTASENDYVLTYDDATKKVSLEVAQGGDVVNDTSPQLGGNLDLNSKNITGTGNIDVTGTITSTGIGQFNDYIDLNTAGNRGKIGYDSNNVYIGSTANAGQIIFKNGITSTDAPQTSGTELVKITSGGILEGISDAEIKTSPIRIHSNTISTNTTVASSENAVSGGPVTIASGVTVTVSGDWTVV